MAEKEGGIGFGTIIFGIIMYNILFGGDDDVDYKKVEIVEDERPAITETVKEGVDNIKPELDAVVKKAKIELDNFKAEVEVAITQKENTEPEPEKKEKIVEKEFESGDSFAQKDIYGDIENKW